MLDDAQRKGHSHVVSWCTDGTSFKIHDPGAMVPILKNYFRQTKFKSLLRQLQGYEFKRVTNGEHKGKVSHPKFVRGKRSECMKMKRKSAKSSPTTLASTKGGLPSSTKSRTGSLASDSSKVVAPKQADSNVMNKLMSGAVKTRNTDKWLNLPQTIPSCEMSEFQLRSIEKSSSSNYGRITPNASVSPDLKQLEINFQMVHNQHQQFHTNPTGHTSSTTGDSAADHHLHEYQKQQQQDSQGFDPLIVESGRTFATSSTKKDDKNNSREASTLKRSAPSQQQQQRLGMINILSHQHLEKRAMKRHRFQEQVQPRHSHYMTLPVSTQIMEQPQQMKFHHQTEDVTFVEDKMKFQGQQGTQRHQYQFNDLEKLFQYSPTEVTISSSHQVFQDTSQTVNSSVGTLDVDVSLTTTTTTTTHHPQSKSNGGSTHVYKDFLLPAECEPTPMATPFDDSSCQRTISDVGSHGNIEITPTICLEPVVEETKGRNYDACEKNMVVRESLEPTSEVSDDIDIGIAQAFEDDIHRTKESENNWWPSSADSSPLEYDCTETDNWTRGVERVVYNSSLDCVLQSEEIQLEATKSFSSSYQTPQFQHHQPQLLLQRQKTQMMNVQKEQGGNNDRVARHAPLPQRQSSVPLQQQMMKSSTMNHPFPILSRPPLFSSPHFIHTQITQLQR